MSCGLACREVVEKKKKAEESFCFEVVEQRIL